MKEKNMSKLKTIALAAGFTALSGNALARETPAVSRDSVSTTTERLFKINRNAKLMLYQIKPFVSEPSAMKLKTSNTPQNH